MFLHALILSYSTQENDMSETLGQKLNAIAANRLRKPRAKPQKTSLQAALEHYSRILKKDPSANRRHYALGAIEVLQKIKELRESIREEMRDLWMQRGEEWAIDKYHLDKEFLNCLDNIMVEDGK